MENTQTGAMNSLREVANTLLDLQAPPEGENVEPDEEQEEDYEEIEVEDAEESFDEGDEESDEQEELGEAQELHTVRVDGEELQVPYDELIAGYSRDQDYRRKTMALADERRSFETERNSVLEMKAQYVEVLPKLIEQAEHALGPEPNYDEMPPDQAATVFRQRQQAKEAINQARAEKEREQAELNQALQQKAQQWFAEQQEIVAKRIPKYNEQVYRQIQDYLVERGADPQIVRTIGDATALTVAWESMQYQKAKAKPTPKTRRGKKPVKPGSRDTVPKPKREFEQVYDRARQTGKIDDIARVIQLDRASNG